MPIPTGVPFHGEIQNTNCSAAQAYTLYAQGAVTTLSVGSLDKVVVEHVVMQAAGTMQCQVFDDQDADGNVDAGELICCLNTATTVTSFWNCNAHPHTCKAGVTPKVLASSTTPVYSVIRGVIIRG